MMYLGIDYGQKRIGLAIGSIIPKSLGTIENSRPEEVFAAIEKICREYEVEKIIFGLPLMPDGQESKMSLETRDFAVKLQKIVNLPIEFEEEQYSSEEAIRLIKQYSSKNKIVSIDEIAAIIILEQYIGGKRK